MSELAVNSKPADGGEAHAAVQTISDNAAADKIGFIIAAPPFFLCFQRKETRQVPIGSRTRNIDPLQEKLKTVRCFCPGTAILDEFHQGSPRALTFAGQVTR